MESTVLENEQAASIRGGDRSGKYLVFHLGREEFGIRVLKVREIMGIQDITAVPQTPAHIKGVINLRGKIIPLVDLAFGHILPGEFLRNAGRGSAYNCLFLGVTQRFCSVRHWHILLWNT